MAPLNHIYLSQLKAMIGVEDTYTGDDFRLQLSIASATQTIENLLGRSLTYQTYTEFYDTNFNYTVRYDTYGISYSGYQVQPTARLIQLKNYPIDTSADIVIYYDTTSAFNISSFDITGDEAPLLLDPSQYVIDPINGTLLLLIDTVDCKRSVQITYNAGYQGVVDPTNSSDTSVAPNIPNDMVMACLFQAMHVYSKQTTNNINSTSQLSTAKSSKSNYVNMAAIAPETMAIIVQNRKPRFAVI